MQMSMHAPLIHPVVAFYCYEMMAQSYYFKALTQICISD